MNNSRIKAPRRHKYICEAYVEGRTEVFVRGENAKDARKKAKQDLYDVGLEPVGKIQIRRV